MKKKILFFIFSMIIIFISIFLYFRVVGVNKSAASNISNADYDLDFFEGAIIKFGATHDNEGRLILTSQSIFLADDFEEVTSLNPDIFYGWIVEEKLSYSSSFKVEVYEHPAYDIEGWFVPEDVYIGAVKENFNVTDKFLKKSSYFEKEYKGFWNNADIITNNNPEKIYIEIIDTNKSDTTYNILLALDFENEQVYKVINVTILDNHQVIFNSYKTVEKNTSLE